MASRCLAFTPEQSGEDLKEIQSERALGCVGGWAVLEGRPLARKWRTDVRVQRSDRRFFGLLVNPKHHRHGG